MSIPVITCRLCSLVFPTVSEQQNHFKSPLHRHNLRRNICNLPAVDESQYENFLSSKDKLVKDPKYQQNLSNTHSTVFTCDLCHKQFMSENQLSNHLQSKKHNEAVGSQSSNITTTSNVDEPQTASNLSESQPESSHSPTDYSIQNGYSATAPLKSNNDRCLFCMYAAPNSFEQLLDHMLITHGFEIPFDQYVTSKQALISYLREKIELLHQCIQCYNRRFDSTDAVRKHMIDKQHLSIDPFSNEQATDLVEYYDLPSTEDEEMDSSDDNDSRQPDEDDEYSMTLPSGSVIGHRSLRIYYKQRLNPSRELAPSESHLSDSVVSLSSHSSIALRNSAQMQPQYNRKTERKHIDQQNKYFVELGVKANRLQRHFRQQVDF